MSPGCAGGAIFNSRAIRAVSAGMSARAVIGALRITAPGGFQNGLRQARPGQSLHLILGDAGSRQDIPAYLQRLGHSVRPLEESAARLSLLLVVGSRPS